VVFFPQNSSRLNGIRRQVDTLVLFDLADDRLCSRTVSVRDLNQTAEPTKIRMFMSVRTTGESLNRRALATCEDSSSDT